MKTVSACLRAAALAVTVVVLGGATVLAQGKYYRGHPAENYAKETKLPKEEGATLGRMTFSSNDRLREALEQAQASLQASPPRYAEAERAYQVALGADRLDFRAHFGLGYLCAAQKRYVEALEHYKRAIELGPSMPEAHFNLALAYLRLNDKEEARKQLTILKKLKPDFANIIEQQINK